MSDTHREPEPDDTPTSRLPSGRAQPERTAADRSDPRTPEAAGRLSDAGSATPATGPDRAETAADSDGVEPAAADSGGFSTAADSGAARSAAGATGVSSAASDPDDWAGPAGRRPSARPRRGRLPESGGGVDSGLGGEAADTPASVPASARGGRRGRRMWRFGPVAEGPLDERQRRRQRWFLIGLVVAAAVVVVALCAGTLSIVSAVDGAKDRAADARAARALREADCLDLEQRLNRLTPPGATSGPAARATAIRDENSALRLYLDQLDNQRDQDAWRQLLDARTVFADALDRQAKSRTPAFFVAPRTSDGLVVTDQLVQWSPALCAGAVRRLAAPEL